MITIKRRVYIPHAEPSDAFAALTDINGIEQLMPRMRRVELYDHQPNQACMVVYMSLGGPLGTIRCEGDLEWHEPDEVVFTVLKPLPVKTRWTIARAVNGTDVRATISLDLVPLLGPVAQLIPQNQVSGIIAGEFEQALRTLYTRVQQHPLRNQAVAA